jgi:predicted phage baseplate assembly protein
VDETRALTLSGFVRFLVPAGHAPGDPSSGGSGPLWFIRCRILAGTFECATRLDRVGVNAVAAEHAASIDAPELIGTSLGHATEIYDTAANPVVAGSTRLSLALGAQHDDRWTETPQWVLVGPHDRRYRLQPELGRITTGNGMRGAVLPAGWDLLLDYRVGGGVEGNIVAGTLAGLAASAWNIARIPGEAAVAAALPVTQPAAAIGGSEAEALAAAEARAVASLSAPTRAVTLGDVVALARAVPGVPVARAKALPNTHPAVPCFTAPGSITIIVVPDCPGVAPMPGEGFLRAVTRFLDRRRPVTTELHVIAPTYVTVTVAATLQVSSTTDPTTLPVLAQTALDRLFNPLHGGPEGAGWPIGRAVYRTEVMALLAGLPGVLTVTSLTLQADAAAPVCGNVDICASDLVRSGQHQITAAITGTTIFRRSRERECF